MQFFLLDSFTEFWRRFCYRFSLGQVLLFICSEASGLYYKQVTIIIYDRNDSGQYYKTTIMIVIDDPSLS